MTKYLCCIIFPLTTLLYSQNFSNGTHLVNNDDKAYTIKYTEFTFSTRICNCKKPTPKMKNGLVSAYMRNNVKGFHIISKKDAPDIAGIEVTAIIDPHTRINCLGVNLRSLEIIGIGKISSVSDRTIVITKGKVTSQ